MYSLTCSLRLILQEITEKQARAKGCTAIILSSACTIIFVSVIIYIYEQDLSNDAMFWTFDVAFIILALVYSVVCIQLLHKLRQLLQDGIRLKAETNTIKMQFIVFLIGYVTKVLYYMTEILLDEDRAFLGELLAGLLNPIWNVIPFTYVLIQHHKTFKV